MGGDDKYLRGAGCLLAVLVHGVNISLANYSKLLTLLGREGLFSERKKAVLVRFFEQIQVRLNLVPIKDVQRPESFLGHSDRAGLDRDRSLLKKTTLRNRRKKEKR